MIQSKLFEYLYQKGRPNGMPTLIDPEQIYPRRMGIYRGALVIQYYNLERDCFKRHVIPFDGQQGSDKIIQGMLKNPKHSVFLRKIAPHQIKQAISGKAISILPSDINQRASEASSSYYGRNHQEESVNTNNNLSQSKNNSNNRENSSSNYLHVGPGSSSGSRSGSGSGFVSGSSYGSASGSGSGSGSNSYGNTTSNQSSSFQQRSDSNNNSSQRTLQADKWSAFKKKDAQQSGSYNLSTSKVNQSRVSDRRKSENNFQDSHGYSMNFQEQSISVVHMKEPEKHNNPIQQQIENYEQDFEQLSAQKLEIPKQIKKEKEKVKLGKEKVKQEKGKKQKIEQFEFLDEQQPKKKKKKKKEKSKQKQKQKGSKQNTISENTSKQASVKQEIPIEEQFDFL